VLDEDRSGRPSVVSEEEKEVLVMASTINNRLTPRGLKKELEFEVSTRTIDRTLQEAGLFGRVALKKRKFDEEEKRKRLSFAEGYKHWSEKEWERVLFADEAIVQGEGGVKEGRQWVRRGVGMKEALRSENVHHTLPHPSQLQIWGCFAASGLGHCYIHNQTLDSKSFVRDILKTGHLLESVEFLFPESPRQQWYLLHDNAPIHKSKLTLEHLHNNGVTVLDFPPYSPDLNPIENLWQHVEKRVEQKGAITMDELQTAISEEWSNTPIELLRKLAHSMPRRCRDVIEVNGDHTRH
jgi:hypothetical protein